MNEGNNNLQPLLYFLFYGPLVFFYFYNIRNSTLQQKSRAAKRLPKVLNVQIEAIQLNQKS